MAIGTYIWIITLNVNGLNAPAKRHRLAEWIQKQDLHTCSLHVCKPTSDLKTHIDWKWEDGKHISWKWEAKESWSRNPYFRQNRS